ncbi:MAG: tetratricopeptide repeat protein, partial [bacterium]|nr:tetratricopeptide repeat protein [bacterium]
AGYTDLGAFYYRQKRYEEALSQWKHWSELTPDNGRAYSSLGAVYSALGRNVEALEILERSVAVEPSYPGYNNLAVLYFRDKRYSELASVFEKALALNDKDYKVWGNLASAYYWSGQKEKATEKFHRAVQMAEEQLKINPRDATVLSQLADYHSMLGNKKQALEYLNQSLKIAPDVIDVIRRSADVYEQLGQRERALRQIELALEKGTSVQELERAPSLKDLRTDPRYQSLLQKLGKKP